MEGAALVWQIYKRFRNSYIGLGGIFLSVKLETQSICILLTIVCIPCFHKVFYFPQTLSTRLWSVVMEIPVPETPALTFTDKEGDVSMWDPRKGFSYLGSWARVPLYRLSLVLCNQTLTSLRTKKLLYIWHPVTDVNVSLYSIFFCWWRPEEQLIVV